MGVCCAMFVLLQTGCASMRRSKIVSEQITTCRSLSREGVSAMEQGDWQRARELLDQAVTTNPTDVDARRQLAEVLWKNGEQNNGRVHMEAAVRLEPQHAQTTVRAGEMLLETGAVELALARAQTAIALEPTLADAWALRGRVYRQQGQQDRALADLQQSLRYGPQSRDVLLEVAQLQYALGRPQRSLTTLHHLMDVFAPGEETQAALWLEGLAYTSLQRHQDAVESLYAASLRGQPQPDLLCELAKAEFAAGRPEAASNVVQQALALDAGHQNSRLLLARLNESVSPDRSGILRR